WTCHARGGGKRRGAGVRVDRGSRALLLFHAQSVHLRRIQRDPERHHSKSQTRALSGGSQEDFENSDEQRLLRESVARFIAHRYDFEGRLRAMQAPEGWSRDAWSDMADLGLLGLPFSEEDGGFGGGGVETMIVMEELGRGLVLEPYLSTVVLAGGAIRHAASAG